MMMLIVNDLIRNAVLVSIVEGITGVPNEIVVHIFLTRIWPLIWDWVS